MAEQSANRKLRSPHLALPPASEYRYKTSGGGGGAKKIRPFKDRRAHAGRLKNELRQALAAGARRRSELTEREASDETLLVLTSAPGYRLPTSKLDARGCRLVAMSSPSSDKEEREEEEPEVAFVSVGDKGSRALDNRIDTYSESVSASSVEERTDTGGDAEVVANTDRISLATLNDLWRGPGTPPPGVHWWQLWLELTATRSEEPLEVLRRLSTDLGLAVGERSLTIGRRTVVHVQGTADQVSGLVGTNALPVEVRPPSNAEEFMEIEFSFREDLVDDLAERTLPIQDENAPVVTVLDEGVLARHRLLKHSLSLNLTLRTDQLTGDWKGHGTPMAGLALYGDLSKALHDKSPLHLAHRIESVRILGLDGDPRGAGDFGAVMADAVSRVEIEAAHARRVYSMSVTDRTDVPSPAAGEPTAWSTAIDALAYGSEISVGEDGNIALLRTPPGPSRLFFVAAGNIRADYDQDHLSRSDLMPVEDPAQSWNAVAVGAYTAMAHLPGEGTDHSGWRPMASEGELSPFSRTGVSLSRRWPNKPDIVMEGGNLLWQAAPEGEIDTRCPPSHSLLSTSQDSVQLLQPTGATSAATAQAARLAALVMDRYPHMHTETVRGLLVHSAEWTPAMWRHFSEAKAFRKSSKKAELGALLRRYGWGVPNEERLLDSSSHDLTLIAQEEFQPFLKNKNKNTLSPAQTHMHALPWPRRELHMLGDETVQMRVTLSYFIEPWAGGQGWRDDFPYPSHHLNFDLPRPGESEKDFRLRLATGSAKNHVVEAKAQRLGVDPGWLLGTKQRERGSLRSDLWQGKASDLAERSHLAVFPAGGWWLRQQHIDRATAPVRYALLISIRTPDIETDLLTPIRSVIETRTAVPVSVPS